MMLWKTVMVVGIMMVVGITFAHGASDRNDTAAQLAGNGTNQTSASASMSQSYLLPPNTSNATRNGSSVTNTSGNLNATQTSSQTVSSTRTIGLPEILLLSPTPTPYLVPWSDVRLHKSVILSERRIARRTAQGTVKLMFAAFNVDWNCSAIVDAWHGNNGSTLPGAAGPITVTNSRHQRPLGNSSLEANRKCLSGQVGTLQCQESFLSIEFPVCEGFQVVNDSIWRLDIRGATALLVPDRGPDTPRPHYHIYLVIRDDFLRPDLTLTHDTIAEARMVAWVSGLVISVLGHPLAALHGPRASSLIPFSQCGVEEPQPYGMEWPVHPSQLQIGDGVLAPWAGAALGNPLIVVLGFFLLHIAASYADPVTRARKLPFRTLLAVVRFPSLEAMVVFPLLQPTMAACTTVFLAADNRSAGQFVAASIGMLLLGIVIIFLFYKLHVDYQAVWLPRGVEENMYKTSSGRLRRFLFGDGIYVDRRKKLRESGKDLYLPRTQDEELSSVGSVEALPDAALLPLNEKQARYPTGRPRKSKRAHVAVVAESAAREPLAKEFRPEIRQKIKKEIDHFLLRTMREPWVRSHYLLFWSVRQHDQWFTLLELAVSMVFGVLEGLLPALSSSSFHRDSLRCRGINTAITCMYGLLLFYLVTRRPLIAVYQLISFAVLTTIEAAAASTAGTAYSWTGLAAVVNGGARVALAAMYIVALKAALDLTLPLIIALGFGTKRAFPKLFRKPTTPDPLEKDIELTEEERVQRRSTLLEGWRKEVEAEHDLTPPLLTPPMYLGQLGADGSPERRITIHDVLEKIEAWQPPTRNPLDMKDVEGMDGHIAALLNEADAALLASSPPLPPRPLPVPSRPPPPPLAAKAKKLVHTPLKKPPAVLHSTSVNRVKFQL